MNKLRFLVNIISAPVNARGGKKLFSIIRICRRMFDKASGVCYIMDSKHFYHKEFFNE